MYSIIDLIINDIYDIYSAFNMTFVLWHLTIVLLSQKPDITRQASSSHNQSSLVLVSDCETSAATL